MESRAIATSGSDIDADEIINNPEFNKGQEEKPISSPGVHLKFFGVEQVASFAFLSDVRGIVAYQDGNLVLFDTKEGKKLSIEVTQAQQFDALVTNFGSHSFATISTYLGQAIVERWEVQNDKITRIKTKAWGHNHSNSRHFATFPYNGNNLLIGRYVLSQPGLELLSMDMQEMQDPIHVGYLPSYPIVTAMASHADKLITGHDDGTIRLWNLNHNQREEKELKKAKDRKIEFQQPLAIISDPPTKMDIPKALQSSNKVKKFFAKAYKSFYEYVTASESDPYAEHRFDAPPAFFGARYSSNTAITALVVLPKQSSFASMSASGKFCLWDSEKQARVYSQAELYTPSCETVNSRFTNQIALLSDDAHDWLCHYFQHISINSNFVMHEDRRQRTHITTFIDSIYFYPLDHPSSLSSSSSPQATIDSEQKCDSFKNGKWSPRQFQPAKRDIDKDKDNTSKLAAENQRGLVIR